MEINGELDEKIKKEGFERVMESARKARIEREYHDYTMSRKVEDKDE